MQLPALPLWLILAHYIADFELQDDDMATRKSKEWRVLAKHVGLYTSAMTIVVYAWLLLFGEFGRTLVGIPFFAITFALHFAVDALTSRWTSSLWFLPLCKMVGMPSQDPYTHLTYIRPTRHRFFCAIGLDQAIHYVCLAYTWAYLVG